MSKSQEKEILSANILTICDFVTVFSFTYDKIIKKGQN